MKKLSLLFAILALAACSVKEDRGFCPAWCVVYSDGYVAEGCKGNLTCNVATDLQSSLDFGSREFSCFEHRGDLVLEVPRNEQVYVDVFCGVDEMSLNGAVLAIPMGCCSDNVYSGHGRVFIHGEEGEAGLPLHKDFAEIIRYAKSLDLNIVVLSNLTLCDERMVALLKEIDPQFVNVSLYAVTEAVHDSITQIPGSCRKTKTAIDALQAAGVHIRIATPFMRENKGCVEELKEYATRRHVHFVADSEIFGQIDHSCANQNHALSIQELEQLLSSHKDVFGKGRIESERCLCDAKVCDIGEGRLNLDAEGKYYPCDGFHGAIIGDARKDSLWDVWTGEALNKLRALKNRDFGNCASCSDRAWCKVCSMRNYNETGNMFTHAPWRCEATRLYRRIFEEK